MIGLRSPSSLGNLACSERNTACASPSLFWEDGCTTWPAVAVVLVSAGRLGTAAVRARGAGAAGASLDCGCSESGPPAGGVAGAAGRVAGGAAVGAGLPIGRLL